MKNIVTRLITAIIVYGISNFGLRYDVPVSLGLGLFSLVCLNLLADVGKTLPIRSLMSFIIMVQLFISPLLTYEYFDNETMYFMHISQKIYMSYIIFAIFSFYIGLQLPLIKISIDETISKLSFGPAYQNLAVSMIVIGLILTTLIRSVPASFQFITYLITILRFVGVFILWFSDNKNKGVWVLIVFGYFALETIRGGVFIELFIWLGFLYMFVEIKFKSSFLRKLITITIGLILVYFIQTVKGDYRNEVWSGNAVESKEQVFFEIAQNKLEEGDAFKSESNNLDRFISRLNTGWIISKVMSHTPAREPFADGELLKEDLISVFLPRFLFPNKGGIGTKEKFNRFTGRRLLGNTTMRIGSFADAYVNFGVVGGGICMFFLGLLFNIILTILFKISTYRPIYLIFISFIFAYTIRMSDFQVILNYTFKSTIFIIVFDYLVVRKVRV